VAYFHENQLTYPIRYEDERDVHFELINISTCLAASEVWFNTAFHRDSFLNAVDDLFRRMPDHRPVHATESIQQKTKVQPQGVRSIRPVAGRREGRMRILWNARWEFDKNPETFFEALKVLKERNVPFGLAIVGQSFSEVPPIFQSARDFFTEEIDQFGYLDSRRQYEDVLTGADIVVSTADHEFFGVAVVEAIFAGAYPVLPNRLAYPEILQVAGDPQMKQFFYDGSVEQLANRLEELSTKVKRDDLWSGNPELARRAVERFEWKNLAPMLDTAIEKTIK
jgi:glycosyltransferase involved in cell wall biosynthesis